MCHSLERVSGANPGTYCNSSLIFLQVESSYKTSQSFCFRTQCIQSKIFEKCCTELHMKTQLSREIRLHQCLLHTLGFMLVFMLPKIYQVISQKKCVHLFEHTTLRASETEIYDFRMLLKKTENAFSIMGCAIRL